MIRLPDSWEWFGDSAILLRHLSKEERIKLLTAKWPPGVIDIVSGPSDVVIQWNEPFVDPRMLDKLMDDAFSLPIAGDANRLHQFHVRYGGADTDLSLVSAAVGCKEEEVIQLHSENEYEVVSTGFSPGFAYLSELAKALQLPRRSVPALKVKKGAVAIAAGYTGIYPRQSAGGWWVIGYLREDEADQLWRWEKNPPELLQIGDRVVFEREKGGGLA